MLPLLLFVALRCLGVLEIVEGTVLHLSLGYPSAGAESVITSDALLSTVLFVEGRVQELLSLEAKVTELRLYVFPEQRGENIPSVLQSSEELQDFFRVYHVKLLICMY